MLYTNTQLATTGDAAGTNMKIGCQGGIFTFKDCGLCTDMRD